MYYLFMTFVYKKSDILSQWDVTNPRIYINDMRYNSVLNSNKHWLTSSTQQFFIFLCSAFIYSFIFRYIFYLFIYFRKSGHLSPIVIIHSIVEILRIWYFDGHLKKKKRLNMDQGLLGIFSHQQLFSVDPFGLLLDEL